MVFRSVNRSWYMYPVGFLFGLGFDTATEVGLLGIAATQAARGLSPWHVLVFPALFTAGMIRVLMLGACSWAFERPLRRLWYNLTITAASVAVALVIGGVEVLGLIGGQLGLEGGIWPLVAGLNDRMGTLGFLTIAMFALVWAGSVAIYRWMGYEAQTVSAAARLPERT